MDIQRCFKIHYILKDLHSFDISLQINNLGPWCSADKKL